MSAVRGRASARPADLESQRASRAVPETRRGGFAPQLALLLVLLMGFAVHSGHRATRAADVKIPPPRTAEPADDDTRRVTWYEAPEISPDGGAPEGGEAEGGEDEDEAEAGGDAASSFEAAERAVREVRGRLMKRDCHAPDCWWQSEPEAVAAIEALQDASRRALAATYGAEPYVVRCRLEFPPSMRVDGDESPSGELVWRMGPAAATPYSTLYFLSRVVADFKSGAFHRNAPHVLQSQIQGPRAEALAFQEASPDFPHVAHSLGYAGRPGGASAFYVNVVDNTRNHGGDRKGEADAIIGILEPASLGVVRRMRTQPGGQKPNGFVKTPADHIRIVSLDLLKGDEARAALEGD